MVKLTNETHNSTIENNKIVLVEYYSKNCGHCIKFAKEYEELATEVKEAGLEFVIAGVDMTEQQ